MAWGQDCAPKPVKVTGRFTGPPSPPQTGFSPLANRSPDRATDIYDVLEEIHSFLRRRRGWILVPVRGMSIRALRRAWQITPALALAAVLVAPDVRAARGDCAQPRSSGSGPVASDCLAILQAGIGLGRCLPECACKVRGAVNVMASDAQRCLVASTGDRAVLACACEPDDLVVLTRVLLPLYAVRFDAGVPEYLDLFVALHEDGSGEIGATVAGDVWIASLAPVVWTRTNDEFRLEAGRLDLWADAFFTWRSITLRLEDFASGDGGVDLGYVEVLWGDVVSSTILFHAAVTASADTDAPVLDVWPYIGIDTPFVGDEFTVYSSEPVLADDLASRVSLVANGSAIDAVVDPADRVGPYATRARILPADYLPFSAEVTLAVDRLDDPLGHPAAWDGRAWTTMDDPGPASENPGFERSEPRWGYGWYGARVGPIYDSGGWQRVGYEAVLDTYEYDRMLGYFDLPADAGYLEFDATVDGGCMDDYCLDGVRVYLAVPGERHEAYAPAVTPNPTVGYSDCYTNVFSIPKQRVRADVAQFAGRRVFVYARTFWRWPCDGYLLHLDDFTVTTAAVPP